MYARRQASRTLYEDLAFVRSRFGADNELLIWRFEPCVDLVDGRCEGRWRLVNARVCDDTKEFLQTRPCDGPRLSSLRELPHTICSPARATGSLLGEPTRGCSCRRQSTIASFIEKFANAFPARFFELGREPLAAKACIAQAKPRTPSAFGEDLGDRRGAAAHYSV